VELEPYVVEIVRLVSDPTAEIVYHVVISDGSLLPIPILAGAVEELKFKLVQTVLVPAIVGEPEEVATVPVI
jgi:hypothetical protein